MSSKLIEVREITKVYRSGETEVHALRSVSVVINKGDFIAIMGASGSGKSTFMNMIGCLDFPTSGEYFLDGVNVNLLDKNQRAEVRNKKIGFIFQSFNILPRTSAIENVELPLLYNSNFNNKEKRERAYAALKAVGLADRAEALPNQLSGGQQQRVAIARALVNDPIVIMADEPTGNLDSRTSYEIMDIFQQLNEKGSTIVMVTHEPDISQFARSMIVFKDGCIISNSEVQQRKYAKEEMMKAAVSEKINQGNENK